MPSLQITQDLPDRGLFRANITSRLGARPIENATVRISNINDPNIVIDEITTDQNGQTDSIELAAPPVEYSLEPNDTQPYSVYNIQVSAPGYETQNFSGPNASTRKNGIRYCSALCDSTAYSLWGISSKNTGRRDQRCHPDR